MGRRRSITAGAISLGLVGASLCAPTEAVAAMILELGTAQESGADAAASEPSVLAGLIPESPAQPGIVELAAVRAWVWNEGRVQRVMLDKDARVTLGGVTYAARKVTLWIEEVSPAGTPSDQRQWNVAAYFADLREAPSTDKKAIATITQSGERVLVTGTFISPPPKLRVDILVREQPSIGDDGAFVREGDERLKRKGTGDGGLGTGGSEQTTPPQATPAPQPQTPTTEPQATSLPPQTAPTDALTPDVADTRGPMPPAERVEVIMPSDGVLNLFWDNAQTVAGPGEGESSMVLTGGAIVQVQTWNDKDGRANPTLQLTAERAVVFLKGGAEAGLARYSLENVTGVYLEGDMVATDGHYTLRGARVYVELPSLRAVALDSVFWTYDTKRGMPLYLRAQTIRQESLNQWSANKAQLANVGFAEPSFAVGATSVTITRRPSAIAAASGGTGGVGEGTTAGEGASGESSGIPGAGLGGSDDRFTIDARNPTFTAGGVPLAWAPKLEGEFRPAPIKSLQYESFAGDNAIRTTFDMYNLLGVDAAAGNDFDLGIDGFFERGVGISPKLSWDDPKMTGELEGYWIYDNGEDHLTSGADIERDGEHRGFVLGENVWRLTDTWTLFAEGAWISDEAFMDAFFPREAETRREFTNSLYARRLTDQDILTAEVRANLNDFVANEYLLQSMGYNTQKLPEFTYTRFEPSLLDGLLNYVGEARYSRMSLNFSEPKLRDYGFDNNRRAGAGFGLTPNQSLAEVFHAQGLSEDTINRFDTRHEFDIPLTAGPINIDPFVVGRFTAWDSAFDEYNNADNDAYRLWGASGLRVGTSLQHVDNSVRSELFDLSRMRHIIEPSVTAWHAGTTIDQNDLPIYDDDVESLGEGTMVRAGARQTWQTYRGGVGHMRNVDWLVLNTDYVWSSGEAEIESPFGRFIEARPEHSNAGRFFTTDAVLQLTDAMALTGSWLFDTDEGRTARTTAGVILDHGYGFSTYAGVRELDPLASTLIDLGARYEFTRKHALGVFVVYDASHDDYQTLGARFTRRFPQWTVDLSISSDRISDDVSASITLRPVGTGGENRRRVYTQEGDATDVLRVEPRSVREGRLDYGPFRED